MPDPDPAGNPPAIAGTPPTSGDWFDTLPPDLKVEKSLQSFKGKGIGEVVKSYVEAQRMIGGSIRLPKPDATPEEKQKFYDDIYGKLGRPESPDKYEAKAPTLPDGTPWDQASQNEFLATAHKQGLNKTQAQALLDWYGGRLAAGMQVQATQMADTERSLKQEWGPSYDRKIALAQKAATEIGGEEFVKLLEDKGLANHPLMLRTLSAYGEGLMESKLVSPDLPGQPGVSEAERELQDIYANREHPYHKGDPKAADRVLELTRITLGAAGRKVMAVT